MRANATRHLHTCARPLITDFNQAWTWASKKIPISNRFTVTRDLRHSSPTPKSGPLPRKSRNKLTAVRNLEVCSGWRIEPIADHGAERNNRIDQNCSTSINELYTYIEILAPAKEMDCGHCAIAVYAIPRNFVGDSENWKIN